MTQVVIPSSTEDRKKLKMMISEMTHCLQRMDMEKESKKEIADEIKRQFDLPTKHINKLASTMYKRNYEDVQAENEDFELLYETLVEGKVADDTAE